MAHNLLLQNGRASMLNIDHVAWHGLGARLDKLTTAKEVIQAANLDR
jgi:hypothetical protein